MKHLTLIFIVASLVACKQDAKKSAFVYPETKKVDTVYNYFGTPVADPYAWLEDDNSEETKAWVIAQNALTFNYLKSIPSREKINARLTQMWNYERFSTPWKKGNRYYFYKNDGLQNQSVLYMQETLEAEAVLLLDPNTLSSDGTVALSDIAISKDGKYLAYSTSTGGSDWVEIFFKNIETGETLADNLKYTKFTSIAWKNDGIYYSRYDAPEKGKELTQESKNHKIYFHKVGTQQDADILIYENPEKPDCIYTTQTTDDEQFLVITSNEASSNNALAIKDLNNVNSKIQWLVEDYENQYAILEHIDGKLFILTNVNAPRNKLIAIDATNPNIKSITEVIPQNENVLEYCSFGGGKIVAQYMKDAHSMVEIYSLTGQKESELQLPGLGTASSFSSQIKEKIGFYSFTSYTVPSIIYSYNFETGESTIFRKPNIDVNPDDYVTKQIFFESKDGTKIPMFVTHKKDIQLNGDNHTLMYGYGGFNVSLKPGFSVSNLIWLENGGIYVVVNMRGGGEYGEEWHQEGTKHKKQNVFDDFIYAAKYLIDNKYTTPKKLAVMGGSNGGTLIGAVINQAPELFGVAIPEVGVMDMLRYHKFTIGWHWAGDYGRSDESEEMFKYLLGYSPLHNIKAEVNYPAVLVTTADHDDRVVPAHSFKYIAELQSKYTGENPVMIRIETMAGHGAGKPTAKRIEEAADIWAFIFKHMNIEL